MTDTSNQSPESLQVWLPDESELSKSWWVRPKWVILAAVIFLGIIMVIFGSSSSQASTDKDISSIRHQKKLLSPLEYQFTGQGKILGAYAETWIIGGVPILTGDQTQAEGRIHPGDNVFIIGHITKNGGWVAERIALTAEQESFFSFAGPLESKSQYNWQVAGITLTVNENSRLGNQIPIGELVLATFQVQSDNSWLATEIQAISALEKARIPTVTPTPTPTPTQTQAPLPTAAPARNQSDEPTPKQPPSKDDSTGQNDLVTVCHKPNSKKGGKTITLQRSALSGHLSHGDTIGSCR